MSELIPAEEHEAFSRAPGPAGGCDRLVARDAIVGIVVARLRNGRSALIPVPEFAQANAGARVQSGERLPALGLPEAGGRVGAQGISSSRMCGGRPGPLLNGEEPAECGNLRAFGGELMGVDIGEFETQKPRLLN